ncbi:hypothetical protein DOS84_10725 [Flavobacterium aquariorum]|uniref:Uncharacterized protein n=1 Tax=Flavobacterium aquariorum TaxID=2217670 RepID=A0A2W7VMG1_9FLAO|nr:hypothetical protein DOS84_10725 [Flavobacterium aquariorum]
MYKQNNSKQEISKTDYSKYLMQYKKADKPLGNDIKFVSTFKNKKSKAEAKSLAISKKVLKILPPRSHFYRKVPNRSK